MMVQFAHPAMLALLVALPALFFLMLRGVTLRRLALQRFGVDRLARAGIWGRVLSLVAIACVALSLAQPNIKTAAIDLAREGEGGSETVFLLDVSRSMLSDDVKPSRLERAKQVIAEMAAQRTADRIALVAFAGTQSVECTLTNDRAFFEEMLKRTGPGSVSRGGTLIGDAIRFALHTAFDDFEQDRKQLVLLTDGGDHQSGPETYLTEAESRGIRVNIGGVGSEVSDSTVPVSASDRTPVRHDGEIVWTHLEALTLRRLAGVAHGQYRNVSDGPLFPEPDPRSVKYQVPWAAISLAAIAFVLLLAESVASKTIRRQTIVVSLMAVLLLDRPLRLNAQETLEDWSQKGWDAFHEVRYFSATEFYKVAVRLSNGQRPDLVFNLASALYADGRYDEALIGFAKAAATTAKDSDLDVKCRKARADALYWKSAGAAPGAAEFMLLTALREYREIVKLRPNLTDAAFNSEVVTRRLAEIRRIDPQLTQPETEGSGRGSTGVLRAGNAVGGRGQQGGHQAVEQDW